MRKETKAKQFTPKVKRAIYERDEGLCVYCGSPDGQAEAHFIARSQGGLGIEENGLTLCFDCHRRYDQTTERKAMREYFREYLAEHYEDFDETNLIYRKGM